jgi:hypothetical protein
MKMLIRILALLALTASVFAADVTKVVAIGQTVTMTASAEGSVPMTYQWLKEGNQVFQGQTYVLAPFAAEQAGIYTVRAMNAFGTAESNDRVILTLGIPVAQGCIQYYRRNAAVLFDSRREGSRRRNVCRARG